MASAVGNLVVRLSAQTKQFSRGMAGAQGIVRRFGSVVGRVGGSLVRFGAVAAAAAAAAAAVGMALLVKSSFKSIDAAAKLSDQIGITTEKLAGLRHAAEITGAGAGKLDAGLQVMQKRLGEVALKGTGAAAPALEAIGLSAKELIRLSPDEQFRTIADAMAGLGTQSERNAVAANIFSRANQSLVNTLALGSKGLDEMQREAEGLGLTFSRVEAAKIEEANDAITRMKGAIGGVANTLAISLAPTVEKIAEWFVNITPKIREVAETIGFAFRNFGAVAQIALIDVVQAGIDKFPILEPAIEKGATLFVAAWAGAKAVFMNLLEGMKGGLQELSNLAEALWEGLKVVPEQLKEGLKKPPGAALREHLERQPWTTVKRGEPPQTRMPEQPEVDKLPSFWKTFTDALAAQKDVKAPDIMEEYIDAYTKARDEMERKFEEGGGLGKMLEAQKQALLESIAAQEAERADAERRRQAPKGIPPIDWTVPEEEADQRTDQGADAGAGRGPHGGVAALMQGSQQAWSAIQANMGQKSGPEAKNLAVQKKQLQTQQRMAAAVDEQLEIARNVELMDIA